MGKDNKPCCAAEAMRRIKPIDVGGIVVGIAMLEDIINDVHEMDLPGRDRIADELLKMIKIYNYVPVAAEEKYRSAILREYENQE